MKLYTIFKADGSQRRTPLGMPVLCPTLAQVRQYVCEGDTVQAWGNSGHAAGKWQADFYGTKLTLRKVANR
jgi:hypothetical protein